MSLDSPHNLTFTIGKIGLLMAGLMGYSTSADEMSVNSSNEQYEDYQQESTQMPSGATPVVVVTGTRHSKDKVLINDFVAIEDIASVPNSVTELLALESGLGANGQPGLFQTLSIRGLARQRVQAYINGMRITSERRAGIAASFVDPLLLSGAEVTQGPASTYYGSGAIAGTIHLLTKQTDSPWLQGGFDSDGNERVVAAGSGADNYSMSFAYRERDNGETAEGAEKNNHFSQYGVNYVQHFDLENFSLDWQVIYTQGDDIGKDNSRFPDSRITSYPEEKHLLNQLTLSSDEDWVARLYWHQQSLITQDIRPTERINRVKTESLDIGASYENQWKTDEFYGLYGVDYFGRRGVDSQETEIDLNSLSQSRFSALNDGEENETALFATANRNFDSWSLHAGLRVNYQSQKSANSASISDNFATYFLTAKKPVGDVELSLSYGTGFRFASLSERLFTGTTGRGSTIGNPNLVPEESVSIDFGVNYQTDNINIEVHLFNTDIDNFIERIRVDDDTRTYSNLTNGDINGWQYQFDYVLNDVLKLSFSGQDIEGENDAGISLSDIPATRHKVALHFEKEDWWLRAAITRRSAKNSFGDGEIPLQKADLASFKAGYQLNPHWSISLNIDNLFDETYFDSADDLGTLATGRSFGFGFIYQ